MRAGRGVLRAMLAAWLVLPSTPLRAEIYRFVDASGRERFTTDLQEVPMDQRTSAEGAAADRGTLSGGFTHAETPAPSAPARAARRATPASQAPSGELVAGRDEAAWRKDRGALAARVETLEAKLAACEKVDAPTPEDPYEPRRNRQQQERKAEVWDDCNRATSYLTAAELALANFDEHARTQGVPPGWLR